MLADPATFCSSRGVGLSDFARETPWRPPSLVLERDPPEHDRARAVLNRALSATVMRSLKSRFAEAAEKLAAELARKGRFDAVAECAEVYPMMVMPDAVGLSKEGREHLLALCGDRVQHVRPRQRAAPGRDRPDGAACRVGLGAVPAGISVGRRHRRDDPCRCRHRRDNPPGGGAAGALAAQRRVRHDRARARRGDARAGDEPRPVRRPARRSVKSARRLRGGGEARVASADLLPHHHAGRRARRLARFPKARRC